MSEETDTGWGNEGLHDSTSDEDFEVLAMKARRHLFGSTDFTWRNGLGQEAKEEESSKPEKVEEKVKDERARRGGKEEGSTEGRIKPAYWGDEDQGIRADQWAYVTPLNRRLPGSTSPPKKWVSPSQASSYYNKGLQWIAKREKLMSQKREVMETERARKEEEELTFSPRTRGTDGCDRDSRRGKDVLEHLAILEEERQVRLWKRKEETEAKVMAECLRKFRVGPGTDEILKTRRNNRRRQPICDWLYQVAKDKQLVESRKQEKEALDHKRKAERGGPLPEQLDKFRSLYNDAIVLEMRRRGLKEQASRAMLKVRKISEGSKAILLKKVGREVQSLVGKECLGFADLVNVFSTLVMPNQGKEAIEDAASKMWKLVAEEERPRNDGMERISIEGVAKVLVHRNLYPSQDLYERSMQLKRQKEERVAKEFERQRREACWEAGKETDLLLKRRIKRFVHQLMNVVCKANDRPLTEENFGMFLKLLGNEGFLTGLNIAVENTASGRDQQDMTKGDIVSLEGKFSLGETSTSAWESNVIKKQDSKGLTRSWEEGWEDEGSVSSEDESDNTKLSEAEKVESDNVKLSQGGKTLDIGKIPEILIAGIEGVYFKPNKLSPNKQPEASDFEKWAFNFFRPGPARIQQQVPEDHEEIPSPQPVSTVQVFPLPSPIKGLPSTPTIANTTDDACVKLSMSRLYEALAALMDSKAAKSRVFEAFGKASGACPEPKEMKIKRPLYKSKLEKAGKKEDLLQRFGRLQNEVEVSIQEKRLEGQQREEEQLMQECTFKPNLINVLNDRLSPPQKSPNLFEEHISRVRQARVSEEKIKEELSQPRYTEQTYAKSRELRLQGPAPFVFRTSNLRRKSPVLYIKVAMGPRQGIIAVRHGDSPDKLADSFAKAYSLESSKRRDLEDLIEANMHT